MHIRASHLSAHELNRMDFPLRTYNTCTMQIHKSQSFSWDHFLTKNNFMIYYRQNLWSADLYTYNHSPLYYRYGLIIIIIIILLTITALQFSIGIHQQPLLHPMILSSSHVLVVNIYILDSTKIPTAHEDVIRRSIIDQSRSSDGHSVHDCISAQ